MPFIDKHLPLVTVGIPTYNRPEGLRRTLTCMVNQTYKNLEIIVSDNASPQKDEIQTIVASFNDTRVRLVQHEKNQGASPNFLYVLHASQGEYFVWAADDDEWEFSFIEECMRNIGNATTAMCGWSIKTQTKFQTYLLPPNEPNAYYDNMICILNSSFLCQVMYGVHKKTPSLLSYQFDFDLSDAYFVMCQCLQEGSIKFIEDKALYTWTMPTDTYEYKSLNPNNKTILEFPKFIKHSIQLIYTSPFLTLKQKIHLLRLYIYRTAILFVNLNKDTKYKDVKLLVKLLSIPMYVKKLFRIFK